MCTYLEDSSVQLYGYNIYGSPFSVNFYDWAFMKEIDDLLPVWQKIPDNTDILITHGPPKYILDANYEGYACGCPNLTDEVKKRIKPLYHIFGHIHEAYGQTKIDNTTYINASSVNLKYHVAN